MSDDDTAETDDWFERALREDDEESGDDEDSGDDGDAAAVGDVDAEPDTFGETGEDTRGESGESPTDWAQNRDTTAATESARSDASGNESRDQNTDSDSPFDDTDSDSPFDDTDSDSPFDDTDSDSPFDDTDSDSPFESGNGASAGDGGGDGPFEGDTATASSVGGAGEPSIESGSDSPFGGRGEGLFDDDFASAFESSGTGEFEDEELESDIDRLQIGIEGLDDMIQGGIPKRHLIVAIGAPGTGKTTFGLQFLHHGLEQGENGVFITLEQSRETILDTANERDWAFDEYEANDQLVVVDLDPVEMANSLDNIRGELPELIEGFDADRLVLDSVSLLEMMYDNPARRRTEVFDFTRSLKDAGVTTFLTSEASESNPYASRHGIIEYLTDAVFVLQYVRSEGTETRLSVEIQKIRNANHSREKKPYEITMDGISVYQQANIF